LGNPKIWKLTTDAELCNVHPLSVFALPILPIYANLDNGNWQKLVKNINVRRSIRKQSHSVNLCQGWQWYQKPRQNCPTLQ